VKRSCRNCYHYDDHDGYKPNDCSEPGYDPVDMLHHGDYNIDNVPFPKERICTKYKNVDEIYRIRYSHSYLQYMLKHLPLLTTEDRAILRKEV